MNWKKIKEKFEIWSLFYRQEIVWFLAGFILGIIVNIIGVIILYIKLNKYLIIIENIFLFLKIKNYQNKFQQYNYKQNK